MSSEAKKGGLISGWIKAALGGLFGLLSGAAAVWATAALDKVVKPSKPVANFAVTTDGLSVTCHNRASGESGWWDFGDGTPLEPFDANTPSIVHQYAKPGNYAIKLIVRNFLNEENERTVPVELSSPPQTLPPTITGLKIEPIGERAVAPATFRIKGEVQNAERVIWDLGTSKLEVTTEPGPFERLVVFDRPGQYPISLIGHSGKIAVKQGATVSVAAPTAGNLSVVLSVRDSAVRLDRQTVLESVPLPPPVKGSRLAEKVVTARPGCTIAEARVGKFNSAVFKTVKTEIAPDKQSLKVIGEYAVEGEAAVKAAGGTAAIIPLTLLEDKPTSVNYPLATVSGQLPPNVNSVSLNLPPQPRGVSGWTRQFKLELREAGVDGRSIVLASADKVTFPLTLPVRESRVMGPLSVTATQSGEQVQVRIAPAR